MRVPFRAPNPTSLSNVIGAKLGNANGESVDIEELGMELGISEETKLCMSEETKFGVSDGKLLEKVLAIEPKKALRLVSFAQGPWDIASDGSDVETAPAALEGAVLDKLEGLLEGELLGAKDLDGVSPGEVPSLGLPLGPCDGLLVGTCEGLIICARTLFAVSDGAVEGFKLPIGEWLGTTAGVYVGTTLVSIGGLSVGAK
jgi:hypothetical protein